MYFLFGWSNWGHGWTSDSDGAMVGGLGSLTWKWKSPSNPRSALALASVSTSCKRWISAARRQSRACDTKLVLSTRFRDTTCFIYTAWCLLFGLARWIDTFGRPVAIVRNAGSFGKPVAIRSVAVMNWPSPYQDGYCAGSVDTPGVLQRMGPAGESPSWDQLRQAASMGQAVGCFSLVFSCVLFSNTAKERRVALACTAGAEF